MNNHTAITGTIFKQYYKLIRDVVVPYQWEILNDRVSDAEKSHCIENFKIAAGNSKGEFHGFVFQDSDFAKWLEAAGNCLQREEIPSFECMADEAIDLIEKAQEKDGYFNTYYQIKASDQQFTNLFEAHELYCAGHLIEGAIEYYRATGKQKVLDIVTKFADLIDSKFGKEDGKIRGYDGHEEIELALVKLYELTGIEKYLNLASFFIDERGREPHFFRDEWEKRGGYSLWAGQKRDLPTDFSYNQSHIPVRQQRTAVGHAVRAVYLYTAMAGVARHKNDDELLNACKAIWDNITQKQMYVTGGIGSTNHGEAFTFDYDLPNDINYSETCASIGLIFFADAMLKNDINSKYADVIERALYNTVLASIQSDGKSYFYVNPMEVYPAASENNPAKRHIKPTRQKWHACACCPPNVARLLSSLDKYIYMQKNSTIYVNLYISSTSVFDIDGKNVSVRMETDYPNEGRVRLFISSAESVSGIIALRIPEWCGNVNFYTDSWQTLPERDRGYALIPYSFDCNSDSESNETDIIADELEIIADFDTPVEMIYADSNVRANAGRVCVQRGPLIYCLEETDNYSNLQRLIIKKSGKFKTVPDQIDGIDFYRIIAEGCIETNADEEPGKLYSTYGKKLNDFQLSFVPYYLWGNRENGEMICWVRHSL